MQAQCILFRRYPEVLEPFKYAGYPMLLQAVALPQQEQTDHPAAHFLAPQQAPRLQVTSCSRCTKLPAVTTTGLCAFHQDVQMSCVIFPFTCIASLPFLLTLPNVAAAWGG